MYSGWASTFGHPERGAEMADHAIRLDPNYQVWEALELLDRILRCRSIRRRAAHPGAALKRQLQLLFLGLSCCELCRARPRRGGEGGHVGCAATLPGPDHRGYYGDRGQQRRRPNPAHRADAGRGVPALCEARDFGEKSAIGAPARMPFKMNWRYVSGETKRSSLCGSNDRCDAHAAAIGDDRSTSTPAVCCAKIAVVAGFGGTHRPTFPRRSGRRWPQIWRDTPKPVTTHRFRRGPQSRSGSLSFP